MNKKKISNQEIGAGYAKIIWKWVKEVDIEKVPTNQFGQASRKQVLVNILNIKLNAKDNAEVKKAFAYLDDRLGVVSDITKKFIGPNTEELKTLKRRVTHLQNQVTSLTSELEEYRRAEVAENWFLKTGFLFRK